MSTVVVLRSLLALTKDPLHACRCKGVHTRTHPEWSDELPSRLFKVSASDSLLLYRLHALMHLSEEQSFSAFVLLSYYSSSQKAR